MIKWNCEEPELGALRYVAANTDISTPRLCRVHRSHHQLAIEMGFFSGCGPLQVCWRNYTCNQKQAIVDEVVAFIKQLRKLEAPCPQRTSRTAVHVATSASARSSDLDLSTTLLRSMLCTRWYCARVGARFVCRLVRRSCRYTNASTKYASRTEISVSKKIIVRDAKVVALIDWECAGWYPGYWEYTRAHQSSISLDSAAAAEPN